MSTTPTAPAPDAAADLDRLYAYAAWMLGDRTAALAAVRSAVATSGSGSLHERLPTLRTAVLAQAAAQHHTPASQRERLDTILRTGTSLSMKMGHPALRSDLRRLPILLTGFMQSCLIGAVQTLQPAQRELFVLLVVLGLPEAEVQELLDSPRAFSSLKSRAMTSFEGYLGPRCGHLHPANPCQCPNRLQIALEQDFIELPEHEATSDRYPAGCFTDFRRMFAALPALRLTAGLRAELGG